ncbi:MAG: 30S ribosomal protein S4 [Candidatus Pacebacteria bacterium]|nr:30S ribosomal protein S4 [Candidatus Paceibacterota bacterium]MBP9772452.1 30S ribosomal protein S4 [Candidatus Paceibacterota bacterium]QQR76492.1 MAG: 30S ribosomal protein S4 [Candidatus Nomurabacteria bacterium]
MITGPKYKMCRRLGSGVFEKCQTQKYTLSEGRKSTSGKRPKQLSGYGEQLLEKQRIRFSYGVSEKQFKNYVKYASSIKGANASEKLYESLEARLDNITYRLGLAHTRNLSRQMVSHGHILVNGKRTTVPSFKVKIGDVITIREGSKKSVLFAELEKKQKTYSMPNWLSFDTARMEGKVIGVPKNADAFLNFNAVLEFYSR